MPSIICDLEPHQIHTFYEAIGYMIAVHDDINVKTRLIEKLMGAPNAQWLGIISEAGKV